MAVAIHGAGAMPTQHPSFTYDEHADSNERQWGMLTHLVGLLSLADMSILGPIATFVLWKMKGKESPYLDDHGREALNFQLSMLLYSIVGTVAVAIVSLGILVLPWIIAMVVVRLVGGIRGAIAAYEGRYYRYPVCIRFIVA